MAKPPLMTPAIRAAVANLFQVIADESTAGASSVHHFDVVLSNGRGGVSHSFGGCDCPECFKASIHALQDTVALLARGDQPGVVADLGDRHGQVH